MRTLQNGCICFVAEVLLIGEFDDLLAAPASHLHFLPLLCNELLDVLAGSDAWDLYFVEADFLLDAWLLLKGLQRSSTELHPGRAGHLDGKGTGRWTRQIFFTAAPSRQHFQLAFQTVHVGLFTCSALAIRQTRFVPGYDRGQVQAGRVLRLCLRFYLQGGHCGLPQGLDFRKDELFGVLAAR